MAHSKTEGSSRNIPVSERMLAQLRESEEKLRIFTDNLAAGMVYQIDSGISGKERNFSYLSPAVERLHGLKVDDVTRDPLLLYNQVIEEDRLLVAKQEARALASGEPLDVEVRVRLPSGEIRWRHFRSAPRLLADGRVLWDGFESDITDRKNTEIALREQKAALEQKNIALKEIMAQIEMERMETRKMVTAGIEKSVRPLLRKMQLTASPRGRKLLDMLEWGLKDITSQFGYRISSLHSLSARESEICNMIRDGLSSKEMGQMLGVSPRTIDTFRNRIRKKLGITRKDINLYAYLHELADDGTAAGSASHPVRRIPKGPRLNRHR